MAHRLTSLEGTNKALNEEMLEMKIMTETLSGPRSRPQPRMMIQGGGYRSDMIVDKPTSFAPPT